MIKKIIKDTKIFSSTSYYLKKFLNGELLYLSLKSEKSRDFLGSLMIDLEMNKAFTSSSALKKLFMIYSPTIKNELSIQTTQNDSLLTFDYKPSKPENTFPFTKEDLYHEEICKGDLFLYEQNGRTFLSLSLQEKLKDSDYPKIKVGRVINLQGFYLIEECATTKKIKEELEIVDCCTYRKKFMINLLNFYIFVSILIFFHVHFYKKENILIF